MVACLHHRLTSPSLQQGTEVHVVLWITFERTLAALAAALDRGVSILHATPRNQWPRQDGDTLWAPADDNLRDVRNCARRSSLTRHVKHGGETLVRGL